MKYWAELNAYFSSWRIKTWEYDNLSNKTVCIFPCSANRHTSSRTTSMTICFVILYQKVQWRWPCPHWSSICQNLQSQKFHTICTRNVNLQIIIKNHVVAKFKECWFTSCCSGSNCTVRSRPKSSSPDVLLLDTSRSISFLLPPPGIWYKIKRLRCLM